MCHEGCRFSSIKCRLISYIMVAVLFSDCIFFLPAIHHSIFMHEHAMGLFLAGLDCDFEWGLYC